MSDTRKREWRFYLDDMIAFTGKVLAYTGHIFSTCINAAQLFPISLR